MNRWNKLLAGFLMAGAVAGCSVDETIPAPDPNGGYADAVYMSASVALPAAGITRSETENTGTEIGKETENRVNTLLLVLATPDDRYIAHGAVGSLSTTQINNKPAVTATVPFSRTDLAAHYPNEGAAASTQIRVYAFCNPTQELLDALNGLKYGQSWVDTRCRVLERDPEGADRNTTVWTDGTFLMSNASVAVRRIPATFDEWVRAYAEQSSPFELSGENGGGIDNSPGNPLGGGPIAVERSVARFDFRDGSVDQGGRDNTYVLNETTEGIQGGSLKVKLTRMGLVNLSKEFYYLRRVSADGLNAHDGICGPETGSNYVVDTDADYKTGPQLDARELGGHYNFCLFGENGTIDDQTRNQWDNYRIDDVTGGPNEDNDAGWTPEQGGSVIPGYRIWRYVTENTVPQDNANQRSGLSTGIVFKGKLLAGDNLAGVNPKLDRAIAGNYRAEAIPRGTYTYQVDGKTYPILYVFQNRLYVGWNDQVISAAEKAGAGSPLYAAVKNANPNGNPDELYQRLVAARGTGDEAGALDAFRAAAKAAGFTLYQASDDAQTDPERNDGTGYYFYYYYWNRHNDNGYPGTMGTMEFAVVRNNVYKLAVTGINKLGHPRITDNDPDPVTPETPDEDGKAYLTVSVEVLPWSVRLNHIEF